MEPNESESPQYDVSVGDGGRGPGESAQYVEVFVVLVKSGYKQKVGWSVLKTG